MAMKNNSAKQWRTLTKHGDKEQQCLVTRSARKWQQCIIMNNNTQQQGQTKNKVQ